MSITGKEVIKAIRDLFKEAGLCTLESDIKRIHEEMIKDSPPPYDTRKEANQTTTSIENEMYMAKFYGLQELLEDKKRKLKLKTHIPLSFIRDIINDEDVKCPNMVKALVITFLNLQNGSNKKESMTILKGSLANTFIVFYGMSKNAAGSEADIKAKEYFDRDESPKNFNAKRPGHKTAIYTDFGNILKLP